MATNDLLQRLDTAALTTGSSDAASDRRRTEKFIAAGAIAANDLVSFDLSQTADSDKMLKVVGADSGTATASIAIGAALGAAAAGDIVEVIVRGLATVAIDGSGTAVAAGDGLVLSGAKLVKDVAGEAVVAQSVGAVSSDTTGKVYFINRF